MFSRSRKKIIVLIMFSLILLYGATLAVIMIASYQQIRKQNSEMLERYVEMYSLEQQPGSQNAGGQKPDSLPFPDPGSIPVDLPGDQGSEFQLSTFYSVALAEDETVLSVDNGARPVYSQEELIGLAKELLNAGKTSGRVGTLSYIVKQNNDYTLVAFMDNTVTESSLGTQLHSILIVGGAAIVILFFISLVLSKRIIRPLEENDRKQKQFISDASHELKTPIAVICTNAEMLYREIGENEWLSNIQYENERMGDLVKQLLDLSRAENKELVMEPLVFSRVVTGEILAFESVAFDQGKTIQSNIEDGVQISGSQTQITQLVSILLDNAIRHSSGSEIEVSLKPQGHNAVLKVINDGDAISGDKLEHLFDRFYRIDEVRNSEEQHYGLGLSIAKAVTEKHGGSIGAACHDGKVLFTVSLPIKK